MAKSNEIEAGARAIAEDLRLPGGGQKKLARVVRNHLDWFDMAEDRGFTWADMSRLLLAAGAKGKNGNAFSVSTLYLTVRRKREDAKHINGGAGSPSKSTTGIQGSKQKLPPRKARLNLAPIRSGNVELPREERQVRRSTSEKPERRSKNGEKKQVEASTERRPSPTKSGTILPKASSKKDLLAFMQRSAAVRGFKSGE
jgi:hypothetical protein